MKVRSSRNWRPIHVPRQVERLRAVGKGIPKYERTEDRLRSELLAAFRGHDAVNPRRGS